MFTAHEVAGDVALAVHLEGVAQQGGIAQLGHEGHGELVEGVAEDDHLGILTQRVQEVLGAGQGVDAGDGLLNGAELQAALPQQIDAPAHEFVIIRLIASGAAQLGNAAFLGKGDPDLGDEDTLHVQTNDIHRERFLSFISARRTAHSPAWRPCR